MIGQSITVLFPPDRLDEEPKILEQLRRGERVDHFETIRVCKDGRCIDVSVTISPIKDATGRVIGALKIARDITGRKQIEAALNDERVILELLNNTGGLIASQLELQALVQSVTDAGKELTGAQFGAFFYNVIDKNGESFLLYTLSGRHERRSRNSACRETRPSSKRPFGAAASFARPTSPRTRGTERCSRTAGCRRATCRCGVIWPCRLFRAPAKSSEVYSLATPISVCLPSAPSDSSWASRRRPRWRSIMRGCTSA